MTSADALNPIVPLAVSIAGVSALLAASSLLMPLARRLALPYSVLIALFGAVAGIGVVYALSGAMPEGGAAAALQRMQLPAEGLLYLFLPPLLFAAGLAVDFRRLLDDMWPVMILAIVAVVVCCLAVGFAVHWATGTALIACLLLGAVVAPTDTAAVLNIFKDVGAPRRLSTIVEGESLFNDAAAIALVVVLVATIEHGGALNAGGAALAFLRALVGGLAIGFLFGYGAAMVVPLARGFVVTETTLSVGLAYVTFVAAQLVFEVSGIIAVIVAALTFAAFARTRLTPGTWESLQALWGQLDFWAVTLIFVFAAMEAPQVLANLQWSDLSGILIVFLAAFASRAAIIYGLLPVFAWFKLAQPIGGAYNLVLLWGGVRGAITVVLALFVSESHGLIAMGEETARIVLIFAIGFVLATLFVNGPTLRLMMRLLGLDRLDASDQMVRDGVLRLSRDRVRREVNAAARDLGLDETAVYGRAETPPAEDASFSPAERVRVGVLALVSRETELAFDYLRRGLIDRDIADILLNHTARMADRVQEAGAQGYVEAAQRNHRPDARFNFAVWLHRRFGLTGPLAQGIAVRMEIMLAKSRLIADLQSFARDELAAVIGSGPTQEILEILGNRALSIRTVQTALDKKYPEYADLVRRRLIERIALSIEENEYRVQRDRTLISAEVFDDLEEDRRVRLRRLDKRPKLDLGLEITGMIARVPLFADVDRDGIARIARLLRPELAVQGEMVIAAGDVGNEMYFIVTGAVDVMVSDPPVRLKDGDFFGEVALLTSRPRNANIVAASYCELLKLRKRDLDALMAQRPALREQIKAAVQTRLGAQAQTD